jgi:hypothetical protein
MPENNFIKQALKQPRNFLLRFNIPLYWLTMKSIKPAIKTNSWFT